MTIFHTPSGIRFGLLGRKKSSPAPALVTLGGDLRQMLSHRDYAPPARILSRHGFLCISLDIPCHGKNIKQGDSKKLQGSLKAWRERLERGDVLMDDFVANVSEVLDHLIAKKYVDPRRIAACGVSRGGFSALHLAAADPRIRCVAAFAPLVDLLSLREFDGMHEHAATCSLALVHLADKLAGRPIWMCVGSNDNRVDTDRVIVFARRLAEASLAQGKSPGVEIHVTPQSGHAVHATAHQEAAVWILKKLTKDI